MIANVGSADRVVRLGLGLALAALALFSGLPLFASAIWFWGALIVATVLVVTAVVRICPLYSLLGISSCRVSR